MPEFVNPTNISILIALLSSAYAILRTFAPHTKTKFDDNLVSLVEKGRATIQQFSLPIWAIVEEMEKAGKISKKSKYGEFLTLFKDMFRRTHGQEMPRELEAEAEVLAAGYSASNNLEKKTLLAKETEK